MLCVFIWPLAGRPFDRHKHTKLVNSLTRRRRQRRPLDGRVVSVAARSGQTGRRRARGRRAPLSRGRRVSDKSIDLGRVRTSRSFSNQGRCVSPGRWPGRRLGRPLSWRESSPLPIRNCTHVDGVKLCGAQTSSLAISPARKQTKKCQKAFAELPAPDPFAKCVVRLPRAAA